MSQITRSGQRVAFADEDSSPIGSPLLELCQRAEHVVNAVLRAHEPDITDEERGPLPQRRVGIDPSKDPQIGRVANYEHVLRPQRTARKGDVAV